VAQFSVYRNKNPRSKAAFPFLVDVQSDLLEGLNTRVVIPMTKAPALTKKPVSHLTPEVSFNGDRYLLMTPQLGGIGVRSSALMRVLWLRSEKPFSLPSTFCSRVFDSAHPWPTKSLHSWASPIATPAAY